MFYNYQGALLISLKDQDLRKNEFLKKWNSEWNLKFIDAVDTRGDLWHQFAYENKISVDATKELLETIKNKKRKSHESLTQGAVGCYLSHIKCWEECLKSKDGDYCLVLEDDSSFSKDVYLKIEEVVNETRIRWGMINLGWHSTTPCQILNNDLAVIDRFILSHAYLLSKYGAEALLRLHEKIEKQVDSFMSDNSREIIILGLRKNICFQNLNMKTNVQTIGVENVKFKNQNNYIMNQNR